ncbi:PAS domain-containing protein [Paracoccus ravus]|uniref:PAS domain-containing protein n=1 Tax=Paracoccus ravus TaxID=2447760 RepID=UPI001ADCE04F|nr:PAS domain-containing protein [Paracoccus ravus]
MNYRNAPSTWPIGGGVAGDLIRRLDWSETSLGPIEDWPQNLRVKVNSLVNSPIPQVLMWGPDHVMIYNDGYIDIAGSNHPRALGGRVDEIWPEIWDWNQRILIEGFKGEVQSFREQSMTLMRHGRAEDVVFDLFYTPIHSTDGLRVDGVLCTVLDITEAVAARRDLAESQAELQILTDSVPALIGFFDSSLTYRLANERYLDVFGVRPDQVIGRHKRDIVGEEYFRARATILKRALSGETQIFDAAIRLPSGETRTFEVRYIPRLGPDKEVSGIFVLMVDIEDRMRTERALRESNQRFAAAVGAVHGVLWTTDPDGVMRGEQLGWTGLTGQQPEEFGGTGWLDAIHPEDRALSLETWRASVATGNTYINEHRIRRRDGEWRNFAIRAVPSFDERGQVREWVGVHTDITEQRKAEALLRERAQDLERQVRQREAAEEQLRQMNEGLESRVEAEVARRHRAENALHQAQKMESIGQLTGGVAHDFNNLLQVVSGNLHLLAEDVAGNARASERVTHALAGVQRGAKLASQLLAFGRRQALEPRVINIGRLIAGMDDLLRHSLGEMIEIALEQPDDLWNSCADPAQVENVLLNLAINARDAMSGAGRLTITLANTRIELDETGDDPEMVAGEYVMLAISDTGSGMSPEILEKVFEPFFSTKPEGKGSGLGLSMVYGFVRQSGGHVAIESTQGSGTVVRVFLPRAMGEAEADTTLGSGLIENGTETILVVEDDEAVRRTVVDLLSGLGYRLLTAKDPEAGLAIVESGTPIDVIFTDVVMPGAMTSRQMVSRAREILPDIAVLYTSGYVEDSMVHDGKLDPDVTLLAKPYSRETLARRLRQVINARPESPSSRRSLNILLAEDDFLIRADTAMTLEDLGHSVSQAANAKQALDALASGDFDLLLTDLGLPDTSGDILAWQALQARPDLALIFATGQSRLPEGSPERAVLLTKPYAEVQIRQAIAAAVARRPS